MDVGASGDDTSGLGEIVRRIIPAISLALLAPLALAQTTRTYSYDALGRLTKVTPGTGTPVCYTHDAADNRTLVTGAANCGSGGGSGSPPQAVNDVFYYEVDAQPWVGDLDVLANDTDADLPGDTLTITAVTGNASATIGSGGTLIHWSGTANGNKTLSYTIKDATNQTSSASVTVWFIYCPGGICP